MSGASTSTTLGDLIIQDRVCSNCHYDLKGLRVGGPCPECGKTIGAARELSGLLGRDGLLGNAPRSYLYSLLVSVGVLGIAASLIPLFMVVLPAYVAPFVSPPAPSDALWSRALAAISTPGSYGLLAARETTLFCWIIGLLVVTRPRALPPEARELIDPRREWIWLRRGVVGTQACWLVAPPLWFLWSQGGADPLRWGGMMGAAVGVLGLPLVAWHLSFLADWASDSRLAERLRGSAWVIAVGCLVLGPIWGLGWLNFGAFAVLRYFSIFFVVIWLIAYLVLVFSLLQMTTMARWARVNQIEADAIDLRRADKARKQREEAEARFAEIDAPAIENPALQALEKAQTSPQHGPPNDEQQYEPTPPDPAADSKLDPYDLEDP